MGNADSNEKRPQDLQDKNTSVHNDAKKSRVTHRKDKTSSSSTSLGNRSRKTTEKRLPARTKKISDETKEIERKRSFRPKTDSPNRKWVGENKHAKKMNYHSEEERHEDGTRKIKSTTEKGDLSFHNDLKKGVEANAKIQKNSLNPHHKLNLNTSAKVRITPLGGLGEIGGNMTVFETEKCAILVDIGMSFPDDSMPGVDILIPDFDYVSKIKDKIVAVLITHAHEDHIGAVPYFYKHFQFPLYGTPLVLGLVGNKFEEHGLKQCKSLFHIVEKRTPIKIGDFEVEWIHITHSIIDSSALAIRTEAGVIIHTGDFKIDHTPIDNLPTDLHRLAHYGEEGVMLLLSDSTNSHKAGVTPSEASVGPTFDNLFKNATGRVIMSTFSSNVHRVYQAITYGLKYNRKVAVIGRSMEKNLEISRELGYINIPSSVFIEAHDVLRYPDEEVLIVTTGSQGETMSALYRMATDEHRHIKIKPTDMIILSAKAIPGNEASVSAIINLIMKAGAKVVYQDFSEIHVSGHAAQEEQKLMLRLIKPKFFLPVHGEYNHIAKHKQTAIACGVPEKNIYLMEDGDQVEVNPSYLRKVRTVKTGKSYIDNQANRHIEDDVVNERNLLSNDGIFILTLRMKADNPNILEHRINIFGIVGQSEEKELGKFVMENIDMNFKGANPSIFKDTKTLETHLFGVLRKLLFKRFKKYPAILINVLFENFTKVKNVQNKLDSQNTESERRANSQPLETVFNEHGTFNNL